MGLDIARALAVIGMMAAHMVSLPELSMLDPATWGALAHGRSSILFAVLAGISVALMTGRAPAVDDERLPGIRLGLVARGAVIFVIGLVLELFGTPIAVILTFYGALYVVAAAVVRWRTSRLLIAAAALAVAGPPLLALLQTFLVGVSGPGADLVFFGTYSLTVWLALMLAGIAIGRLRLERTRVRWALLAVGLLLTGVGYGVGALAATGDAGAGSSSFSTSDADVSFGSDVADVPVGVPGEDIDLSGTLCDDYGDGYITCYPKEGSISESGSSSWYGADEGEGASGWGEYFAEVIAQDPWVTATDAVVAVYPHSGGTAEVVGSGGFAVAVIAACLLLSRVLRWALPPLAALGSMPLTAYTAHVVSYGLIAGPGGSIESTAVWLWSVAVLIVGASLWSIFRGRGPLEALTARISRAAAGGMPDRRPVEQQSTL